MDSLGKRLRFEENESTMNLFRKSVSYNLKQARQELSAFWATYQPVNQGTKVVEYAYKNEIQQLIKVA